MNDSLGSILIEYMAKIQPQASKKEKKTAYQELLIFVNSNDLNEEHLTTLFAGDEDAKIIGLLDLVGKQTSTGSFKDSTKKIISILHDLMFLSKKQNKFRDDFVIYEDNIKNMLLGEHFYTNKTKDAAFARKVLELIKVVIDKRPALELKDYIKRGYIEEVVKGLEEYEKEKKKNEESKIQKTFYIDKLVSEAAGSISLEPKTWDEVLKLKNKKLLTTEFLSLNYNPGKDKMNFVDEDKELEDEFIDNFVDPLTKNQSKLNFLGFEEEERKKMHLQCETYDPVYFLEKLYAEITLKDFENCLSNLVSNIALCSDDDGNLIDKNIYKYLDCKKLLDFLVDKFKNSQQTSFESLKIALNNLQSKIITSLAPLKSSFILILKSKSSKEIILKFSKFFMMKEKIDHYLKFSNFEELANYLKKINVEIKEISQNRFIYREFYDYFSKTIDQFKITLVNIIKDSSVNDLVIKHFRYLLEFDVEVETVDELLNGLKEKMCLKIKTDLESTENFEIRNFKDFFCEEFNVENVNDDVYAEKIKDAEDFINSNGHSNEDNDLNDKEGNKNKKKNLINVESIIKTLYEEIKDFLFMMKVLEENINLKIIHLSSQKNIKFSSVVTEVYYTLFEKLEEFLFHSDFSMNEIIQKNFDEKKLFALFHEEYLDNDRVLALLKYYEDNSSTTKTIFNEKFNKSSLQNLSNLIIDLFDLFEIYQDAEILEALNESKNLTIKKIFMAFLNEKILSNLSICNEENTINFFDTNLSIFNFSAFNLTKTFLKNIFKSYKNIIEFFLNILIKTKDVTLDHKVIYESLFFILKTFMLKFYDFYFTEAEGPVDYNRFNLLIVEILRNYNYLKIEIISILKNIFKNKFMEYEPYLIDLNNFISLMKNLFHNIYIENSSKLLFSMFLPNLGITDTASSATYSYSFYDKYNDILLQDRSSGDNLYIFTDLRSSSIEMILNLAQGINIFHQLEKQNNICDDTTFTNDKVLNITREIIHKFYEKLFFYLKKQKTQKKEEFYNLKKLSQMLLEIEFFNEVISNFMPADGRLVESVKKTLLQSLLHIKNKDPIDFPDETVVFSEEELGRKKRVIDDYLKIYSNYLKCFKIKS